MNTTVIEPTKGWRALKPGELWEYRELLYFLMWKDIKVRYKQTVIGAAWAIIQPFVTMVIFSLFFGKLAKIPSEGVPYPIFAYSALVVWTYFANSVTSAAQSVVNYQNVITKVYFPRIFLPLSHIIRNLLDFGLAFIILLGMMFYYRIVPTVYLWTIPLFLLLAVLTAAGVGLWLSSLNVLYRDVQYATAFLVQAWLFATPIAYPSSIVPEKWRALYGLNPMAGVVEGFRWALLGSTAPDFRMISVSVLVVIAFFVGGLFFFRFTETTFADVV